MVDVGGKPETERVAVARGEVHLQPETVVMIRQGLMKKGDVLTVAQVAGIQAAKRTADLIPLCHPLALSQVDVHLEVDDAIPGVMITATVRVYGKTGVEMEALTAATVALLTIYDMCKAVDKQMVIERVELIEKAKKDIV